MQAVLTVGAVYAGVLVVTEKEATVALALIAAHGVDTDLLAATVVVLALIHILEKRKRRGEEMSRLELVGRRHSRCLQQLMKGGTPWCRTIDTAWAPSMTPGYGDAAWAHPMTPGYYGATW